MTGLFLAAMFCLTPLAALADNVTIIRNPDAQVRDLPGNAQIVTGGGREKIVIEGDRNIWRDMVYGPRTRIYAPGQGSVSSTCPVSLPVVERNRCVRELMKAQEKIRKRYND